MRLGVSRERAALERIARLDYRGNPSPEQEIAREALAATAGVTRADELAEQVALMYGWTGVGAHDSDRAKALHELWSEWLDEYRLSGGKEFPPDHPELSDARIKELAARRDATVARTMGRIKKLVETS